MVLAHFVRRLDALSDQQTTDSSNRSFTPSRWSRAPPRLSAPSAGYAQNNTNLSCSVFTNCPNSVCLFYCILHCSEILEEYLITTVQHKSVKLHVGGMRCQCAVLTPQHNFCRHLPEHTKIGAVVSLFPQVATKTPTKRPVQT